MQLVNLPFKPIVHPSKHAKLIIPPNFFKSLLLNRLFEVLSLFFILNFLSNDRSGRHDLRYDFSSSVTYLGQLFTTYSSQFARPRAKCSITLLLFEENRHRGKIRQKINHRVFFAVAVCG